MMTTKQPTRADEWKKTAKLWCHKYRIQRRWTIGLAITNGVLLLLALVALTVKLASSPQPIEYAKEPVSFTINGKETAEGEYTPEHVLACVKMRNGGTSCSGTVISRGTKYAAIVSAAHCIQGNIGNSCTWINPDKSEFEGELLAYDRNLDVCLFRAPVEKVLGHSYVPHTFPGTDAKWEACGYTAGGGLKYKQVHPVKSNGVGKDYNYAVDEGPFGGGDSGGSVFGDGGLVGVISCCEGSAANKWNKLIIPGSSHASLISFLKQNVEKLVDCGPWGCPPQQRREGYRNQPPGWTPGDNIPIIVPPNTPPIPQIPQPPVPPPVPPICEPYDDSKLLSEIDKIKKLIDGLQLQSGKDGKDGLPGKDGRDGKDGQSCDPAELAEIKARLLALENRPSYDDRKLLAEINVLQSRLIALENRKPEDVTIYLKDAKTKQDLARPVTVPAGSNVTYPIERVQTE